MTALAAVQRELVPAIRGLSSPSRFNVVSFGTAIDAWREELVLATEDARDDALRFVGGLDARGPTAAQAALERAFDLEGVEVVFFLSDGIPTDATEAEIISRVAELNEGRRVTVNTVGVGEDLDEAFMRDLARSTGGVPPSRRITDENGEYSFHNPVAGTYRIRADASGYHSQTVTVGFRTGDDERVDFRLRPEGGSAGSIESGPRRKDP